MAPEHPSMTDAPQAQAQALPLPEQTPVAQEGEHIPHQEPAPSVATPPFDAAS